MDNSIIVLGFFGIYDQMKFYHWTTSRYSRHMASDEFLKVISNLIDNFVEIYQGKYGKIKLTTNKNIVIDNLTDDNIANFLISFRNFLLNDLPRFIDQKDTDLLTIRDEMLGITNKTLYLFTLY